MKAEIHNLKLTWSPGLFFSFGSLEQTLRSWSTDVLAEKTALKALSEMVIMSYRHAFNQVS